MGSDFFGGYSLDEDGPQMTLIFADYVDCPLITLIVAD
jgi:hypothetical protein